MIDWAKALIGLVKIISSVIDWLKTQQLISEGRSLEIADEFSRQADIIRKARIVQDQAEASHKKDSTDDAFDKNFFRKD